MLKNKDKIEFIEEGGEKYITLKEASEISKYAPDYVGQLIREGKIAGKQVYSNVAWVTTEAALRQYMSGKGKALVEDEGRAASLIEARGEHLAKIALYAVIGVSALFLLTLLYILAVTIDHRLTESFEDEAIVDTL